MATTGVAPIKQALVRALRDNLALKALVGADGINEGIAPRESDFPYIVYTIVYANREWFNESVVISCDVDVWSVSADQVEAHTLDQLVADALEFKVLDVEPSSGQTSFNCQRLGDLSSVDLDGASNRVFQMGASYRIWTDQSRTA